MNGESDCGACVAAELCTWLGSDCFREYSRQDKEQILINFARDVWQGQAEQSGESAQLTPEEAFEWLAARYPVDHILSALPSAESADHYDNRPYPGNSARSIVIALAFGIVVSSAGFSVWWAQKNGVHAGDIAGSVAALVQQQDQLPRCLPPGYISRDADKKYEGIYYFANELDSMPVRQEGRANYYSYEEGAGTIIGHGEAFDPMAITAASWFYPIDTWVRVTDLNTGKRINVRINDRGPNRVKYPFVIIDLTEGAIRALSPTANSLTVSVEPVCP